MVTIDSVIKEINPANDYKMMNKSLKQLGILDPFKKSPLMLPLRLYNLTKPLIRGGIVGASVGTLVSLLSGNNIKTGALCGALIGAALDSIQYVPRFVYHYLKSSSK